MEIKKNDYKITENFVIIIDKLFSSSIDFNDIQFENLKKDKFQIEYRYTIDKINFLFDQPASDYYPVIIGTKILDKQPQIQDLTPNSNIDNELSLFLFTNVLYQNEIVNFKLILLDSIINKEPKWNFYDNMLPVLENWKKQLDAISNMFGHKMIYFKTEPTATNHILANHYIKDIVAIKKMMIVVPQNNLPKDMIVYTEWDQQPVDEIYFDVVDSLFKQAFGDNSQPQQGDAIYFPLINKYFRVTSVQPKNGFMGYVGWWTVYITDYENNESINFSDEIAQAYEGSEFETDYEELIKVNERNHENILQETIEEKKDVTENFTNRITDNNMYIDVKETEYLRQLIHQRLDLVKIKPDKELFPVTVYDLMKIRHNVIAITYNLTEYTKLNKFSLTPINKININLNFILQKRFNGVILDLLTENDSIWFSLLIQSKKLYFNFTGKEKVFVADLTELEFYNFNFEINESKILITINKLQNKIKTLIATQEFNDNNLLLSLTKIYLYGGKYYVNDLMLFIDDNKILHDYCNAILKY